MRVCLCILAVAAGAAFAAVARPAPAPPVAEVPSRLGLEADALAYVPADADLAACVRLAELADTLLWVRFADPRAGLYGRLRGLLPVALDPQEDVREVALAAKMTYDEAGRPEGVRLGLALTLARETTAAALAPDAPPPERVPGLPRPVVTLPGGWRMIRANPTTVLLARGGYLADLVRARETGPAAPGGPDDCSLRRALAQPGHATLAVRVPPEFKEAVRLELAAWRERTVRPGLAGRDLFTLALHENLFGLAADAETLAGVLDLRQTEGAVRLALALESDRMTETAAAALKALAGPLATGLPATLGAEPWVRPAEAGPLYEVATPRHAVWVTMRREVLKGFVDHLVGGALREAGRRASADHLRTLYDAVAAHHKAEGAYPKAWADLGERVADPAWLRNPALERGFADADYALVPLVPEVAREKPFTRVLAYERFRGAAPSAGAVHVLFADGTVEWMAWDRARALLADTYAALERASETD